jgi:hypothetical protein
MSGDSMLMGGVRGDGGIGDEIETFCMGDFE